MTGDPSTHRRPRLVRATALLATLGVAGLLVTAPATGVYVYVPNLLVIDTSEEADAFLDQMEIALGVQPSDDPRWADRPDLKRLDRTVKVMEKHWERLDRDCDPNAVFALMYLMTTYGVRDHLEEGYFDDNDYLAIITVAFAKMYLDAYDAWERGDREDAPPAWLEAFDWASSGQSSILEDEFLGMNAHINYDLAVAEAAVGITNDAGDSRKPDMDRINHVLHDVTDDVQYWIAYYYGPEPPTTPPSQEHSNATDFSEYTLILEPIYVWREQAWVNAELITAAPDASAREAHDETMREYSWTVAQGFKTPKLVSPAQERLDYCETHG
jgi:hypothetical protein